MSSGSKSSTDGGAAPKAVPCPFTDVRYTDGKGNDVRPKGKGWQPKGEGHKGKDFRRKGKRENPELKARVWVVYPREVARGRMFALKARVVPEVKARVWVVNPREVARGRMFALKARVVNPREVARET